MMPKVVVLTGLIGAGKSTVMDEIRSLGGEALSADNYTAEIYKDRSVQKLLIKNFGVNVISSNQVNREFLREILRKDDTNRLKLNEITHPIIMEKILKDLESFQESDIVFLEIPLYFDAEELIKKFLDVSLIIFVLANQDIRLSRILKRSNISREQALYLIDKQKLTSKNIEKSNYLIYNDGSLEDLKVKTKNIYKQVVKELR